MPIYTVSYLCQTKPNLWEYRNNAFDSLDDAVGFVKLHGFSSNVRQIKIIKMAMDKVIYDSSRHDLEKLTPSGDYQSDDRPWQTTFIRQKEQKRYKYYETLFEAVDLAKRWIRENGRGEVHVKSIDDSGYWFVGSDGCYWDGTQTHPMKYYCKRDRRDRVDPCNPDCLCSAWIR